jgi:hypothetical protein
VIYTNFEQMLHFLTWIARPSLYFVRRHITVLWCFSFRQRYQLVGMSCYRSEIVYIAPRGSLGMALLLVVSPSSSGQKPDSCAQIDYSDEDDRVVVRAKG